MKLNIRAALIAGGFAATLGTGIFVGQAIAGQPHMDAALDHLRAARSELQDATHNKGGHRAKAIADIDDAIEQVRRGMDDAY